MRMVFIGAANPETLRMASAVATADPSFVPWGFVDNDPGKAGTEFHGLRVFGGMEMIPGLLADDVRFVNLITGDIAARLEVTRDALRLGAKLANFLHPGINLDMVDLGVGNYIQEGVILQAGVRVGDNSSIHMGALVGHESSIGNTTFVAHAVSISGKCEIGDGCFIGTNATILPRIKVGNWSVIGAGAVVTKDVPANSVVVGNPARVVRTNPAEYECGRIFP